MVSLGNYGHVERCCDLPRCVRTRVRGKSHSSSNRCRLVGDSADRTSSASAKARLCCSSATLFHDVAGLNEEVDVARVFDEKFVDVAGLVEQSRLGVDRLLEHGAATITDQAKPQPDR